VEEQRMPESGFFCDISKLTAADRARLQVVSGSLASAGPAIDELPDGYGLTFDGDRTTFQLVTERLGYERVCCTFLDIQVRSESSGRSIVVALTGRPGVKDFIREEFARFLQVR
jgi:hypothetical protein